VLHVSGLNGSDASVAHQPVSGKPDSGLIRALMSCPYVLPGPGWLSREHRGPTIMDNTNLLCKDSESLLASDSEDEGLYVPTQRRLARRITITAALTVVNLAVLLATMVFWLSSSKYDGCLPRLNGAGDVQDAIDAHAIEYEVRSYSKPLEYDEASHKAVIASNGDRNYVGPPSLETDAAWSDLLRGMCRAIPLHTLQTMSY
jgi:hypothetical protein